MGVATYYDEYWSETGSGYQGRPQPAVAEVFEERFPDGQADCLDVGCGDGQSAGVYLSSHARSYVGVDVSPEVVEQARSLGLDARTIEDAADLPFDDDSFDFLVCFEVFEHLFSTEQAAAEIARVLRPGGVAMIQVPNVAHWRHRLELGLRGRFLALGDLETLARPWRDPHIRFFTFAAMTGLLRQVGLEIVEATGVGANQLTQVPVLHRFAKTRAPGAVSRRLMEARPALFGERILVLATPAR
jgi:methionine biosynthesis protein MetW